MSSSCLLEVSFGLLVCFCLLVCVPYVCYHSFFVEQARRKALITRQKKSSQKKSRILIIRKYKDLFGISYKFPNGASLWVHHVAAARGLDPHRPPSMLSCEWLTCCLWILWKERLRRCSVNPQFGSELHHYNWNNGQRDWLTRYAIHDRYTDCLAEVSFCSLGIVERQRAACVIA